MAPTLTHCLATVYRRLADLLDTGACDMSRLEVVVHDAGQVLADPDVRAVVEEIARHGHRVGVAMEVRGAEPPSQFILGGSLVAAVTMGRVTYRQAVFPQRLRSDRAGVEVTGPPLAR